MTCDAARIIERTLPQTAVWLAHYRLCAGGGGRYRIETSLRLNRHMDYHKVSFAKVA
jgi:hypothetical protein